MFAVKFRSPGPKLDADGAVVAEIVQVLVQLLHVPAGIAALLSSR